jgi:hypothetical protein
MNNNVNWEEAIEKAEEFALAEIEKYGTPLKLHFDSVNTKGVELAEQLNANKNIVQIGTRLMDVKVGEAVAHNKIKEHVKMSSEATKEFLLQFKIEFEDLDKIINCIEGHHKDIGWNCIEAEICANADCYKFLVVKNLIAYIKLLNKRGLGIDEGLRIAKEKVEEKWSILSLDTCKKELEPHYKIIKEMILSKK